MFREGIPAALRESVNVWQNAGSSPAHRRIRDDPAAGLAHMNFLLERPNFTKIRAKSTTADEFVDINWSL